MGLLLACSALVIGLLLLAAGADRLIHGAVGLARRARVSEAVIGATIVAGGTSAPELVASLTGAWSGHYGLAVGNVVGSNSFNVGLILGVVGLVTPLAVPREILRRDWWVMAAASVALCGFALLAAATGVDGDPDGARLPRWFCALLAASFAACTWWGIRSGAENEDTPHERLPLPAALLWTGLGIAGLCGGGWLLVEGAVGLARLAGMSDTLIGLTIVAAGTSAPELVTSLLAARRGRHALAVANIVGSNTFNILLILGVSGLFAGLPVDAQLVRSDLWVMLGFALALPLAWGLGRARIGRPAAALLLAAYLAYTSWLIAQAAG